MTHTVTNYREEESFDGLYFLRDALSCEQLGFSVLDVDTDREGKEHDHADDGEEEVYLLVEGEAELTVEGETLTMEPGDAVRIDPEATRELNVRKDSLLVLAGAP